MSTPNNIIYVHYTYFVVIQLTPLNVSVLNSETKFLGKVSFYVKMHARKPTPLKQQHLTHACNCARHSYLYKTASGTTKKYMYLYRERERIEKKKHTQNKTTILREGRHRYYTHLFQLGRYHVDTHSSIYFGIFRLHSVNPLFRFFFFFLFFFLFQLNGRENMTLPIAAN